MTKTINLTCAVLSFLFLFSSTTLLSQDGQGNEDIESFKIAFLTKRLSLTSDEAKVFWPVYDEFSKELNAVRTKKRRQQQEATKNFLSMSDAQFNTYIDNQVMFMQNETAVFVKYHERFKKVLPPRKVALFYKAKEDFTRHLLKKMRNNAEQRGN